MHRLAPLSSCWEIFAWKMEQGSQRQFLLLPCSPRWKYSVPLTQLPDWCRALFLSCYLQSSVQISEGVQKHKFKENPQRCRKPQPWHQQFLLFSASSVTRSFPFPVTSLYLEVVHHFLKDAFFPHNKAANVQFYTSQLSLPCLFDLLQHLEGTGLSTISCTLAHISFHLYSLLDE